MADSGKDKDDRAVKALQLQLSGNSNVIFDALSQAFKQSPEFMKMVETALHLYKMKQSPLGSLLEMLAEFTNAPKDEPAKEKEQPEQTNP